MASFLERLRAPMLRGQGFGSETAGDTDQLSQAASLANLDRLLGGSLSGGGRGGGRNLAMRGPGGVGPRYNPYGRAQGPQGPMNVVYDQGPEQFEKKLKRTDRELDIREKQVDALSGLKRDEVDIKQQNANTNQARAEAIMARQDLTDAEKMDLILRNAVVGEQVKQGGRMELAGVNNASRASIAGGRNQTAKEIADANAANRLAVVAAQSKGAADRQNDAQAFTAGRPREQAEGLRNRAHAVANERMTPPGAITFDDEGNFVINPDLDNETRARITESIYGPRDVQLSEQPGVSNQNNLNPALTGTQGQVPVRRQRNPATGQTRESRDGGRTWTIVGR